MRERSTWDRERIAKLAADPDSMRPENLQAQPAADAYVIGTPSDFAEDVSPSRWKDEYDSTGYTRVNEIGMPAFRPDTFKTAAEKQEEDEKLEKKAEVCLQLSKHLLKNASTQLLEDQALGFMHLPDSVLIDTVRRLASDEDQQDDDDKDKGKQAQDQQQDQADDDKDKGKQAQDQQQQDEDPDKKKQAQDQQQQDDADKEKKEAREKLAAKALVAMQQGDMATANQMVQQLAQQQVQQQQVQSQQQLEAQLQDMVQQAVQQQLQQQPPQQQAQQQQPMQQQPQMEMANDDMGFFQDMGPSMMVDDVAVDPDLQQIFASAPEAQNAQAAFGITASAADPGTRTKTAASRTLGTKPPGVSRIGGTPGSDLPATGSDNLANLWDAPPDVRHAFR
jgi:hypothetical protein